ncbi:MAG TPA: QsdR family transcriptional regulator [Solirubrobacteraceae bacterium]|nr:QsdR family transcriptional regulator [Solirubrobacteraceae bacterium]
MSTRPTASDAFRLARRRWLAGERVDMSAMAIELDVNRVTLYRWIGSRETLLVEIVWGLAERTLAAVSDEIGGRGAERVIAVITRFTEVVIASAGMQRWLAEEGELAMRLLTRSDRGFQPRLIDWVDGLLEREQVELDADRREVAYVIVRVIESYTYLDLILGERPDARRAESILRLLLR